MCHVKIPVIDQQLFEDELIVLNPSFLEHGRVREDYAPIQRLLLTGRTRMDRCM